MYPNYLLSYIPFRLIYVDYGFNWVNNYTILLSAIGLKYLKFHFIYLLMYINYKFKNDQRITTNEHQVD